MPEPVLKWRGAPVLMWQELVLVPVQEQVLVLVLKQVLMRVLELKVLLPLSELKLLGVQVHAGRNQEAWNGKGFAGGQRAGCALALPGS